MHKTNGKGQLRPLTKRLNRQALIRRAERILARKPANDSSK